MDSFFFNITGSSYKQSYIFKNDNEYIKRVDISNGVVFYDIFTVKTKKVIHIKNLDRIVIIPVVKEWLFYLKDNIKDTSYKLLANSMDIFLSSRQDLTFELNSSKKTKIFILFIADFILKRYLSSNQNGIINYLYNNMQKDISLELIDKKPLDALSLYIIDKTLHLKVDQSMASIKCEYYILEFIIHRLSLIDRFDKKLNKELNFRT